MRVLHLVKTSVGATWAYRQMSELVKRGVEVHVALPTAGGLETQYRQAGIKVHLAHTGFSITHPTRSLRAIRQLRALVAAVQPDMVHSHFVSTTLTMRLGLRSNPIPRVFQVPGPLHLESPFFKRAELATRGQQDYWIGSCQWTSATYRQAGIPADHVFMSFYGTDIPEHTPSSYTLRAELGLPAETRIAGIVAYMYAPKRYLGQTRGLKGHEDLIDALALCRSHGLPITGVLVGGAWNNAKGYEHQVREYGRSRLGEHAIFLGTRYDVLQLYGDFDVAVHPSHSENLGGAVESMMLGIPTITTNVGGFPDIIKDNETGWLVPPKSPAALAAKIEHVLAHPDEARACAVRGQTLVRHELDVRRTAGQVYDIYQRILSG